MKARRAPLGFAALPGLALALATAAAAADPAADVDLPDRSRDRICRRAGIATQFGRHGEVRLVQRGRSHVVQTLLHTKLLRRALGEIREREQEGWPEGAADREASHRYLEALERAERSLPRPGSADAGGDRRRALLIEFALSPDGQTVALLAPRVARSDAALTIEEARGIESLALPRSFVRGDMLRIVAEHFPELDAAALGSGAVPAEWGCGEPETAPSGEEAARGAR